MTHSEEVSAHAELGPTGMGAPANGRQQCGAAGEAWSPVLLRAQSTLQAPQELPTAGAS